ncbi:MAG: DUF2235 domain-containing protein [Brevundimonas sp.]|nr:DUF2235 domain-containing protein [Brevundimonas sp.]
MPSDPKHIVLLCDGTANHLGTDLSNIARIFRCLEKDEKQLVFYNSGVGTVGADMWWSERARRAKALFEQATGYSIDQDIISIYGFLCTQYNPGDQISLFGFSRGAYTIRIVAALIHMVGILPRDQVNLAGFALSYLKIISSKDGAADKSDFERVYEFSRVAGARSAEVSFLGLFDTVSSLILPGRNGPFPGLATLPHTRRNPSVRTVRHAAAIDEKRAMFRLNRWEEPQPFIQDRFDVPQPPPEQDIKQVWFAGVHSDIGGGYPEQDSGLAKIPLHWMIEEAKLSGLKFSDRRIEKYVLGVERSGKDEFASPNPIASAHDSLKGSYIFELIPKMRRFAETRLPRWPVYLPLGEPRNLTRTRPRPLIHQSVLDRIAAGDYRPINLPPEHEVEPWSQSWTTRR